MTTDIRRVAVVGLGTMGAGIAEEFARSGFEVVGIEADQAALERGRDHLQRSTDRAVARGKLTAPDQRQLFESLELTTEFSRVRECQLVVEAVFEDAATKKSIFRRLGEEAREDTVLATNTSSLSITAIAAATSHPGRVAGVHFFNPAPVQKLVEVVSTVLTDGETVSRLEPVLRRLGKTPIHTSDRAGFIVNSLLIGYLNRAVLLYAEGVATREEIDRAMVEQAGYPQGPLALLDLIGLDVALAVLDRMYDETRDRLLAPAPLLQQLVSAGLLGRKSERGFYTYEGTDASDAPGPVRTQMRTLQPTDPRGSARTQALAQTLVVPYLNDAVKMVQTGFATPDDVDTGMREGCRMPNPFDVLADQGPVEVLAAQREVFGETAEPGHRPARLLEELAAAPDPAAALDRLRRG